MSASDSAAATGPLPHLLVVDDDPDIVEIIRVYFGRQGFRVTGVTDGVAMRRVLAAGVVALVLLDLGLPGEDGFELTRYLRDQWRGPVIIVTGRGESVDRIVGLELGADDYVTKPFDLRELLARIRSVIRRTDSRAQPLGDVASIFRFGPFRLDTAARRLTCAGGVEVQLTTGEYDLLKVFLDQPNHVLTRDELITRMHGREAGPFDRAIDVQIGRLRRKIEADPANPVWIKSVRGAGYLFTARPLRS